MVGEMSETSLKLLDSLIIQLISVGYRLDAIDLFFRMAVLAKKHKVVFLHLLNIFDNFIYVQ